LGLSGLENAVHVYVCYAQQHVGKVYQPVALFNSHEAYGLVRKGVAQEESNTLETELPMFVNPAHLHLRGVLQRRNSRGVRARRSSVARSRRSLAQGFVGALFVKLLTEPIKAHLLSAYRGRWRRRGGGFQGSMKPFMATVFLRPAWPDPRGLDAEAHPPDA
jgi:hypothetical protein